MRDERQMLDRIQVVRYSEAFGGKPDDLIPILPVGNFARFGRKVKITPPMLEEMISNFDQGVPGFRPAVKYTHEDATGAAGHIDKLVIRDGKLFASVEWTEEGRRRVEAGEFRYISPEIWWNLDYEGKQYQNVLKAAALLNDPYFGQETALFSAEDMEASMDVKMLMAALEKAVMGLLNGPQGGDMPPEMPTMEEDEMMGKKQEMYSAPQESEEFKAVQAELAKFKAQAEAAELKAAELEKAQARSSKLAQFSADGIAGDVAELLADVSDDELAGKLATAFKAKQEQVDQSALFGELGSASPVTGDEASRFAALVDEKVKNGLGRADALVQAGREHPDWAKAYRGQN